MRNLKRFLAMALTVLMVVGSFSAMSVSAFDDVTDYQEAIDVMAALGILCGEDESTFNPGDPIARWQMALIITKMMTGKVDAAYVEANFNTALNSTVYSDLNEGQYMGATAYAANNGIVVGTSATTFEPEAEIMIQDVFTMVVRMLGYGSTAMNANYPWSFIDKAISLDLDAGLPADYANEKAATRGETAQILYNALTAVKADGSTLGYDFFGLEKATVIITGTKDGNMFDANAKLVTKTVTELDEDGNEVKVDYVAFNVLNADGTIGATTYYAPKTAFGIAQTANANAFVGYPFVVRTNDGFDTFMTCDAIEPEVLTQADVEGASANSAPANGIVTIKGDKYTLVKTYSDFSVDGADEIILNMEGTLANVIDYGSYVMDENLNILKKDGSILLYWVTTQGFDIGINYANLNGTYLYKVAEGKYIVPNDAIWAQAATYVDETSAEGFTTITNSNTQIYANGAYSDTVVFDLDGDGKYDRGIYTQYEFAKMTKDGDYLAITQDGKTFKLDPDTKLANMTVVNTDGEAVDVVGKYVLFTYNDLYKTVIVKAEYDVSTGLVTTVNIPAAKITFNQYGLDFINGSAAITGETYDIGKARLKGVVSAASEGYFTAAIGKNMNYVVDEDGDILAVADYANGPYYMVVATEQVVNYTTMGYQTILAYFNTATNKAAATQGLVTVNALNNYWYGGMINNAIAGAQPNFVRGDLLKATKDAMGNYDVVEVALADYTYAAGTIEVTNGIVLSNDIAGFKPFKAAADTVWLVFNPTTKAINTYVGIPLDGSIIDATNVFVTSDNKFVYAIGTVTNFGTVSSNNGWNAQSTIVYVDDTCANAWLGTNVFGNQLFYTDTYSYNNAIDIYTGAYVNNLYTANGMARLQKGHFYKVEAGYVVAEVNAADYVDAGILTSADKEGKLAADADKYNYELYADINPADIKNNEYQLVAGQTPVDTTALATLYGMKNTTDVINVDALIETNRDAGSGDELILANIYAAVNDADKKTGALVWYAARNIDGTPYTTAAPVFFAKDATAITVKGVPTTEPDDFTVVAAENLRVLTTENTWVNAATGNFNEDGEATAFVRVEGFTAEQLADYAIYEVIAGVADIELLDENDSIGVSDGNPLFSITFDESMLDANNTITFKAVSNYVAPEAAQVEFYVPEYLNGVFSVSNGLGQNNVDVTADGVSIDYAKNINVEVNDGYAVVPKTGSYSFKYHFAVDCVDAECNDARHWKKLTLKKDYVAVTDWTCWNLNLTEDHACNDGVIRIMINATVEAPYTLTVVNDDAVKFDISDDEKATFEFNGEGSNPTTYTFTGTKILGQDKVINIATDKINTKAIVKIAEEGTDVHSWDYWDYTLDAEDFEAEVEIVKVYTPTITVNVSGTADEYVPAIRMTNNGFLTTTSTGPSYVYTGEAVEDFAEIDGIYALVLEYDPNEGKPTIKVNGTVDNSAEIAGDYDKYLVLVLDEADFGTTGAVTIDIIQ